MKEKLIENSRIALERAIRYYLTKDHQFLINAAVSFELLGKARLASIHPSLIVDRDFDSFLHVCSAGKHARRAPWNIRTITATEVLSRCTQLDPRLSEFSVRLKLLAEVRNSAIHLGEVVEDERAGIFHALIAATSMMVDEMGILREEYFGEYSDLVASRLDASLVEVNRVITERVAYSKTEYEHTYGTLDKEHLQTIIESVERGYLLEKYEDQLCECPACGNQGVLTGRIDVEWDVDFDDEGNPQGGFPTVILTPLEFACHICKLELDGAAELKAVKLDKRIWLEQVDAEDFYGEPDDYNY